jgi:hypothetical protein
VGPQAIQKHVQDVGNAVNRMTGDLNKVIIAICPPA